MYTSFYNLATEPFLQNPDDSFFWSNKRLDEQVDTLKRAVLEQRGIFLLSGTEGVGKTHFTDALLNRLHNKIEQGYIVISSQNKLRFFNDILLAFGIEQKVVSKVQFTVLFTSFLQSVQQVNKMALLVADDAHNMRQDLLDELRQLTNIENNGVKLLNILLVGQPELVNSFSEVKNKSLKEKIVVNDFVETLSIKEIGQYIQHRVLASGGDPEIFSKSAVAAIAELSNGNIAIINKLAHLSLLDGLKQKQRRLAKDNVVRAVNGNERVQQVEQESGFVKSAIRYPERKETNSTNIPDLMPQDSIADVQEQKMFLMTSTSWLVFGIILVVSAVVFYLPEVFDSIIVQQDNVLQEEAVQTEQNILQGSFTAMQNTVVQAEAETVSQESVQQSTVVKNKEPVVDERPGKGELNIVDQTVAPVKLPADKKKKYPIVENVSSQDITYPSSDNQNEEDQIKMLAAMSSQPGNISDDQAQKVVSQAIPELLKKTLLLETKPNSSFITEQSEAVLSEFIRQVEAFPEAEILVEGFIASKKNSEENILLSKKRATIVADILIKNGIGKEKITVNGLGNQKPLASNDTAEGRRKNRRVEVSIRKLQ